MPDPRARLKGLANLGALIDERIRANTSQLVDIPQSTAPSVPLSQGGYPGASGEGDSPIVPESWVESLQAAGTTQPPLSGALALTGAGDTRVTQAPISPHFTVTSPAYTAGDGVKRVGDEFQVDGTVVRTSGEQDIAGVKHFVEFPTTPAAPPSGDYDAANKKYVDDNTACHWQRQDSVLRPKQLADAVELQNYLQAERASAGSVAFAAKLSGEQFPRCAIQADGAHAWGDGLGYDAMLARLGPHALGLASGDGFRSGEYCESVLRGAHPATPDSGFSRLFHRSDTRAYSLEPGGAVHDLCVAHKQTFPANGGADGRVVQLAYAATAFPTGALAPPDFTATGEAGISWSAGAALLNTACAKFSWTSLAQQDLVSIGAQLALGAPCRRWGGTLTLRARLRVNNPARFSAVYLSVNDEAAHSAATANLLGNLVADTWYDAVLSGVDASAWGAQLRLVLTVKGTTAAADVGATQLIVESLSIEQWAK